MKFLGVLFAAVGCISAAPLVCSPLLDCISAKIGGYPGYDALKAEGDVTVSFSGTTMNVTYQLEGLEKKTTGGLHIHAGKSCKKASEVGDHWYKVAADPWDTKYATSDKRGDTEGQFTLDTGYELKDVVGHAVVLYAGDADIRIGCGVLKLKADDDEPDDEPDKPDDSSKESKEPKEPKKESGGKGDSSKESKEPKESKEESDSKDDCDYKKAKGKGGKDKGAKDKGANNTTCTTPPACEDGQRPKREGCCLTCNSQKKKCSKEQKKACKTSMSTLPECDAQGKGPAGKHWNSAACCATCKRPAKRTKDKQTSKCSKEDQKACRDSNSTQICEDEENPVKLDGQCCYSCKRAEREKKIRDVAKCGNLDECGADEVPVLVVGSKCRSCKPAKPTCAENCGAGTRCARDSEDEDAGTCKETKLATYIFKGMEALDKAFAAGATEEEIAATLAEVIARFCDNPDNADLCANKQAVIDSIKVIIAKRFDDATEVNVETVDEPAPVSSPGSREAVDEPVPVSSPGSRRLLAGSNLLDSAIADPDATGGLSITAEVPQTAPAEVVSGATTNQVPGVFVALVFAAGALLL